MILVDSILLTPKEVAGWLRLSLATLECWRCRYPDRGPRWIRVAGMPRYVVADVRAWLVAAQRSGSRSTEL